MSLRYLFTILFLILPVIAGGEIREIYGLKLEQGEIRKLDSQLLSVDLFDEVKIVSEDQLLNHIISRNFSESKTSFSLEELAAFAEQALQDNNVQALVSTFYKVASLNPESSEKIAPFARLVQNPLFFEYLVSHPGELLNSDNYNSLFWQDIFWSLLARSYPNSAAERTILSKFKFNPELLSSVLEYKLLTELNQTGNSLDCQKKLQRSLALANTFTQQNLQAFLVYYTELNESRNFLSNLNKIIKEQASYYKKSGEAVRKLIYREINTQIDQQKNFKTAFDLLLTINFNERTETEHELLLRIVESLTMDQAVILLLEPYQRTIRVFAEKDDRIKSALIKKNEEVLEFYYSNNDPLGAEDYLKNLQSFIEDPAASQALIIRHIKLLEVKGLKAQAAEHYKRISNEISTWDKILLSFRGVLTLLISLVLAAVFFVISIKLYLRKRKSAEGSAAVKINGRLSPKFQRFSALLSYFELSRDATIADIKKAYRRKVKNLHPDLNPQQEETQNNEFMEVTEKYEELLNLLDEISKEAPDENSPKN